MDTYEKIYVHVYLIMYGTFIMSSSVNRISLINTYLEVLSMERLRVDFRSDIDLHSLIAHVGSGRGFGPTSVYAVDRVFPR